MKRILFVDDEPRILDGLKRMLRPMRKEWEMAFALCGKEALAILEGQEFDVVISDMRMPGMDGAALLGQVQERWPGTVRVVLSGHAELEASIRAVPVAHQFLTKPCDADTVKDTVRRIFALRDVLEEDVIQSTVGKLDTLPAQPQVYAQLLKSLADPEYTAEDLAKVIEQDVGLTAKILQTVNSGFFGRAKSVKDLKHAVSILGTNLIKNMTLSSEVFGTFKEPRDVPGFSVEETQRHSMLTAGIAHKIMRGDPRASDGFTAAILHDIGKLILACHLPAWLSEAMEAAREDGRPLYRVEAERNGASHAEVGAYLLGLWALPTPIVEAVAHHHHPRRAGTKELDTLAAVHIANALAHECAEGVAPGAPEPEGKLDVDFVQEIGAADKLPQWRAEAEELASAQLQESHNGH